MIRSGEQFLHQKDTKLHTTVNVEHEKTRQEIKGEKTSQKPADKIADWLKVIEHTHTSHRDDPRVLERIKKHYHKEHINLTLEDIPQSYWNNKADIMMRQGYGGDMEQAGVTKEMYIDKKGEKQNNYFFSEEMKQEELEVILANQTRSLDKWINYLTSEDATYPTWAKYWAFTSMLKMGKFEKIATEDSEEEPEKSRFQKRDKTTTNSFPLLNPRALALTIGAMTSHLEDKERIKQVKQKPKQDRESEALKSKVDNLSNRLDDEEFLKLLSSEKFATLYAQFLLEIPEYSTEGLQDIRGEWKKYLQNSDPKELVESLDGYPLEWCTAELDTAQTQLNGGDFYVYYSHDQAGESKIPRLAIRMEGQNKIAEPPRGIASNQNLDPYISPILEEKMSDFGQEGERYKQRIADMKQLTEIDDIYKKGGELTKDDLRFLYEMDTKIEGFGYSKDSRIKEILNERNLQEDASIIFECTPEQIATSAEEIDENTKAYIGEWSVAVFNVIKEYPNIEHLYEFFLDKKIFMQSLETDPKINSSETAIQALKDKNMYLSEWGKDILEKTEFSKSPEIYDLVKFTVAQLGIIRRATTDEIYQKAEELGLELCPAEVGPQLRLQNTSKEWMLIAMKQITDRDGYPKVFRLGRSGDQPLLNGSNARSHNKCSSGNEFIFRYRKLEI